MYRDAGLALQAEKYRTGANTHYLTSTLHMYFNAGSEKYKHLFTSEKLDQLEDELQRFVGNKGVQRQATEEEVSRVYTKMGWKR